MGKFLSGMAEITQTEVDNEFVTSHNTAYKDDDGTIYFVPRYFRTDGFTIPTWIAWIAGGAMQSDIRPAIVHDMACFYHQITKVNLTEAEMWEKGYLRYVVKDIGRVATKILTCEDIPIEHLEVVKISFNKTNDLFKRCMLATGNITKARANLLRAGVNFNIGWIFDGQFDIDLDKYYVDIVGKKY